MEALPEQISRFEWPELVASYQARQANAYEPEDASHWGLGSMSQDDFDAALRDGFDFHAEAKLQAIPRHTAERAKLTWTDDSEGAFDYDAFALGETECYRKRARRKDRAGVRVKIGIGFYAGVDAQDLARYGVIAGEAIAALRTRGKDLEVEAFSRAKNVYRPGPTSVTETRVMLSRFGQRTMIRQWGALFTTGGFRHLIFHARRVAGRERYGTDCRIGGSVHPEYGITYNARAHELVIDCASTKPLLQENEDRMRQQLREIVGQMR